MAIAEAPAEVHRPAGPGDSHGAQMSQKRRRRASRKGPVVGAGRTGDAAVQQVKSSNGGDEQQLKTLWSLGLGGIGRSARFNSASKQAQGQIRKVSHLVAVKPLTRKARLALQLPKEESRMTQAVHYDIGGPPAFRLDVGDKSFLSVEQHDEYVTVSWSTLLDIAQVLKALDRELPDAKDGSPVLDDGSAVLYDARTKRHERTNSFQALRRLRRGKDPIPFARVQFGDLTLAWTSSQMPKHVDEDVTPGRLSVAVKHFDRALLARMVHDTGTAPLGERAEQVVAEAERKLTEAAPA